MNIEDKFTEAAFLIRRAAGLLDQIAREDRAAWAKYEPRLIDVGADRLELVADECELRAAIMDAGVAAAQLAAE